jgi:hypothetical protein
MGVLASDGDESDELRLAGGDEFVAEAFELQIVACFDRGASVITSPLACCRRFGPLG